MPFIALGGTDGAKLELSVPSKGDTNWSEEIKTSCFQKIVDHDHTTGKGVRIPAGGLAADSVITVKILDDNVTPAKINILDDSLAATTTHFMIADGSDYSSFALSGDLTCTNAGVITIGNDRIDSQHYAATSIDAEHLSNDMITVAKKITYSQTLAGGTATTITSISTLIDSTADKAIKLNYRIHNSGTTTIVQTGTVTGQAGDYITDEFTGTDIASFSWSGTNLQLTGVADDVLTYSIEFLE